MNGKKARKLRKLARKHTKGEPVRAYRERSGTIELVPTCRRAVYQALKRVRPKP